MYDEDDQSYRQQEQHEQQQWEEASEKKPPRYLYFPMGMSHPSRDAISSFNGNYERLYLPRDVFADWCIDGNIDNPLQEEYRITNDEMMKNIFILSSQSSLNALELESMDKEIKNIKRFTNLLFLTTALLSCACLMSYFH